MSELPPDIYQNVLAFSERGDELAADGEYVAAISEYGEALTLIPGPKNNWAATTWLLAATADAAFLANEPEFALETLSYAMTCPDAIGNPFLHLRFGQVLFILGQLDRAADELMRAYMGGGAEMFVDEHPRFLEFLGTRAQL